VIEAASTGDAVSSAILEAAAQEVAVTVAGAARILPSDEVVTVGLTGGLTRAPELVDRLRAHLKTRLGDVNLRIEAQAPVNGALRLAAEPDLRRAFPGLVHPPVEAA
jgi:predicted NBD/HSP70 family sugar kinase